MRYEILTFIAAFILVAGAAGMGRAQEQEAANTPDKQQIQNSQETDKTPAPEAAADDLSLYKSFAISTPDDPVRGCLWRLPGLARDGMEMHAALTYVVDDRQGSELLLQMAGGRAQERMVMPMRIASGRLLAGPEFDSEKMALEVEADEALRIALPPAERDRLVEGLAQHGGKLSFTLMDEEQVFDYELPPAPAEAVALWHACLDGLHPKERQE